MGSESEAERLVLKAIRKHLRDGDLAKTLAWLRLRVDAYRKLERLG